MKFDLKDGDTQVIIFAVFLVVAAIGGIIAYLHGDKDLRNRDKVEQIDANFKDEFKNIGTPPKTAVNKYESSKNYSSFVFAATRYRTELSEDEFENYFKDKLKKQGWIFYHEESVSGRKLNFCKGKFDAKLELENDYLQSDNANYYRLGFSLGDRNLGEELPSGCHQ